MPETTERPTRSRIVDAAIAVLGRDGLHALTLEAVAAEAGISKGGLLYHFPAKQDLVHGLVRDLVDTFAAEVERRAAATSETGRWSRAYLEATEADCDNAGRWLAALSAFATEPALLDPWRALATSWYQQDIEEGADPVATMSVFLAADGLWIADVLGMQRCTGGLRNAVVGHLRGMTGESQP